MRFLNYILKTKVSISIVVFFLPQVFNLILLLRLQEVTPFSTAREPGYWDDRNNRRQYLFSLAEKMRFDPMVEANWNGKTLLIQANQVRIFEYQQQKEEGLIFTYITKIGCGSPCQVWKVVKSIAR